MSRNLFFRTTIDFVDFAVILVFLVLGLEPLGLEKKIVDFDFECSLDITKIGEYSFFNFPSPFSPRPIHLALQIPLLRK